MKSHYVKQIILEASQDKCLCRFGTIFAKIRWYRSSSVIHKEAIFVVFVANREVNPRGWHNVSLGTQHGSAHECRGLNTSSSACVVREFLVVQHSLFFILYNYFI